MKCASTAFVANFVGNFVEPGNPSIAWREAPGDSASDRTSAVPPSFTPDLLLPSTGPRRVTPATPSGTVRPHPASLSASDPRSQPDVTAINRSATRYTCYAQRNGPGAGSSRTCPLNLGARNWTCEVNRARPQAVGVGCGDKTAAAAWSSTPNPCKIRVKRRVLWRFAAEGEILPRYRVILFFASMSLSRGRLRLGLGLRAGVAFWLNSTAAGPG
jgi:hypothetical protein